MAIKRHLLIIKRDDGIEMHPMKEWLRHHPDRMPQGLDPDPTKSTSHQLRSGLRKMGWLMEETATEVRLFEQGVTPSEIEEAEAEATFGLEYQLRDFLADNLGVIEIDGRRLSLYKDAKGDGVEYPTAVGPIDILAVDGSGNFFVFELKRANSPDRAVGQIARYMGWVKETIGRDRGVFGVIVAKSISKKLKFARSAVPNIFLFEYEVSFELKQAHDLALGSH